MGGKIDGYLDCTSPYSYIALVYLRRQRELLKQYDVEVEFHPVFLGGINVATGNSPPFTVPAKRHYGKYDMSRAIAYYQIKPIRSPPFFPILSILPQRCMCYIKSRYSNSTFEEAFLLTWEYSFVKHIDISKPENMAMCLAETFPEKEVKVIMEKAGSKEYKEMLTANTKKVVEEYGAFGAPWFWMQNGKGQCEPLFGSDRWPYMWEFMGVDYEKGGIVDKTGSSQDKEIGGGAGKGEQMMLEARTRADEMMKARL